MRGAAGGIEKKRDKATGALYRGSPFHGPVAQLGERLHGMQEVMGSIPFRSTESARLPAAWGPAARVSRGLWPVHRRAGPRVDQGADRADSSEGVGPVSVPVAPDPPSLVAT